MSQRDITTLRAWFDAFTAETGETPTMIAIKSWDSVRNYRFEDETADPVPFNTLGGDILDREFDDGYGGNDSPDLCAWSENFVIFSDTYDGSESLQWVPRNPIAHTPIRPGGG